MVHGYRGIRRVLDGNCLHGVCLEPSVSVRAMNAAAIARSGYDHGLQSQSGSGCPAPNRADVRCLLGQCVCRSLADSAFLRRCAAAWPGLCSPIPYPLPTDSCCSSCIPIPTFHHSQRKKTAADFVSVFRSDSVRAASVPSPHDASAASVRFRRSSDPTRDIADASL